jgi:hypothetical protein
MCECTAQCVRPTPVNANMVSLERFDGKNGANFDGVVNGGGVENGLSGMPKHFADSIRVAFQ